MSSSDDDLCKIVENTPHDNEGDLKNVGDESVESSEGGEKLNPFASFAFGGPTVPAPAVPPSGGAKRRKVDMGESDTKDDSNHNVYMRTIQIIQLQKQCSDRLFTIRIPTVQWVG